MNLCSLHQQRDLRDLARLHEWPEEVAWLEAGDLAVCPEPAVLAGFWLQEDPAAARQVIAARAATGAITLLVPRLPNLNYVQHVNAPADVEVRHKPFQQVHLEGSRAYAVPGQAMIKSPLAHGKWGISEFGQSVVLSFRASENLGWVIFCTASICSRTIGVDAKEQRSLLAAILKQASASSFAKATVALPVPGPIIAASVETLLAEQGRAAAPWLLALLASGGHHDETQVRVAAARLGLVLDDAFSLATIPASPVDRLAGALIKQGWGAYVRRIRTHSQEVSHS